MTRAAAEPASNRPKRRRPRGVMAAAVVSRPGRVEVREAPIPEPGEGQVRVRLEGCGVCASNIPPWEGRDWFNYPMAPGQLGHEGWGFIDAIGPDVSGLTEGDRVATLSERSYAEYDLVEAASAVRLPPSLDGRPFPGEPLGCAVNIFRRSDVRAGQHVAIIGAGFLGALLSRLCARAGARVIAISRRPFSLEVARRMGAHDTLDLAGDTWRTVDRVKELTGGQLCERVFEAAGKQEPLELAGELCAERGRLIVAGYHQDGMRQVNMQLWNWRGLDVTNAHERDPRVYVEGIGRAVEAVASGELDPNPLYTHAFTLHRLGEALEMTRSRPDGFVKALILFRGSGT